MKALRYVKYESWKSHKSDTASTRILFFRFPQLPRPTLPNPEENQVALSKLFLSKKYKGQIHLAQRRLLQFAISNLRVWHSLRSSNLFMDKHTDLIEYGVKKVIKAQYRQTSEILGVRFQITSLQQIVQ